MCFLKADGKLRLKMRFKMGGIGKCRSDTARQSGRESCWLCFRFTLQFSSGDDDNELTADGWEGERSTGRKYYTTQLFHRIEGLWSANSRVYNKPIWKWKKDEKLWTKNRNWIIHKWLDWRFSTDQQVNDVRMKKFRVISLSDLYVQETTVARMLFLIFLFLLSSYHRIIRIGHFNKTIWFKSFSAVEKISQAIANCVEIAAKKIFLLSRMKISFPSLFSKLRKHKWNVLRKSHFFLTPFANNFESLQENAKNKKISRSSRKKKLAMQQCRLDMKNDFSSLWKIFQKDFPAFIAIFQITNTWEKEESCRATCLTTEKWETENY